MENNQVIDFRYQFKFVCSLFQKDLWQEVKANYDYIIDYFLKGDMAVKKNNIQVGIINYLNAINPGEYNVDQFYAYLIRDGHLIKEEALALCELVAETQNNPDKSQYTAVSKQLKDIANTTAQSRAEAVAQGDPTVYNEEIKKFTYLTSFSAKINVMYMDQYTIQELQDEYLDPSKVLQSAFPFINRASCIGGYPTGQIIAVTSPPGGGKTLFMMKEASHMARNGHKVVYIALADMNIFDFYVRMYSMDKHVPFENSTTTNFGQAYEYGASFGKSVAIIIEAAGVLTMDEVVDYILQNIPDAEAVFADYDSQFLIENQKGNMYDDAVQPYIAASRLKKAGITTFIGCQPKHHLIGVDYIDMSGLGESSKKQQVIDFMISIGSNDETLCPCGYIAMPKARRMFNKFKVPFVRSNCGSMIEVPYSVYSELRPTPIDPNLSHDKIMEKIATKNSPGATFGDGQVGFSGGAIPPPPSNGGASPLLNIGSLGLAGSGTPSVPTL